MSLRPVLYVEDDQKDVGLMELAFKEAEIRNLLVVVSNGDEVIEYLSGTDRFSDRVKHPLPCLILLDIQMPGTSGLEVLKWIRTQPSVAAVPVLMLTMSANDADVHRAYLVGANGYVTKPTKMEEMVVVARGIRNFWLDLNRNPFA